jgi:hypothetical protein
LLGGWLPFPPASVDLVACSWRKWPILPRGFLEPDRFHFAIDIFQLVTSKSLLSSAIFYFALAGFKLASDRFDLSSNELMFASDRFLLASSNFDFESNSFFSSSAIFLLELVRAFRASCRCFLSTERFQLDIVRRKLVPNRYKLKIDRCKLASNLFQINLFDTSWNLFDDRRNRTSSRNPRLAWRDHRFATRRRRVVSRWRRVSATGKSNVARSSRTLPRSRTIVSSGPGANRAGAPSSSLTLYKRQLPDLVPRFRVDLGGDVGTGGQRVHDRSRGRGPSGRLVAVETWDVALVDARRESPWRGPFIREAHPTVVGYRRGDPFHRVRPWGCAFVPPSVWSPSRWWRRPSSTATTRAPASTAPAWPPTRR